LLGLVVAIAAWLVSSKLAVSAITRVQIAGAAGSLALLVVVAYIIMTSPQKETARRAAAEDPGRVFAWVMVLIVCAFSLFSATFVLSNAKSLPDTEGKLVLWLTLGSTVVAWFLTHGTFTLRYAHLYYRGEKDDRGGIDFPGDDDPDDFDFAYFAFTLGMTFQVSDTEITDRLIRRTAIVHGILSFAYNTGIVALVLNIVMARLGDT